MSKQITFIDEDIEQSSQKKNSCRLHLYANRPEDFIEVTIKKTGAIVVRCRACEKDKQEQKRIRTMDWKKHKDEISDYYVCHTLKMGKTGIKGEIPKELIEAKKAVIQLKNLTAKMEEPLKTCSTHGKLYKEDVIKSGKSQWNGEQQWKCRQCMKEMHAKHYQLNKAKVKAAHVKYRKENGDKVRATLKASKEKMLVKYLDLNGEHILKRYKLKNKNINQKSADREQQRLLSDTYVKKSLTKRSGLPISAIPQSLIDCKRALLRLKRSVKKQQEINIIKLLEEKLGVKNK